MRFFDVTDVNQIFNGTTLTLDTIQSEVGNRATANVTYRGTAATDGFAPGEDLNIDETANGNDLLIDADISGSVDVEAGRQYLFLMETVVFARDSGDVHTTTNDFLNTSSFEFLDLDGAQYISQSGAFLTAVPEPVTVAFFALSVGGLLHFRTRRSAANK